MQTYRVLKLVTQRRTIDLAGCVCFLHSNGCCHGYLIASNADNPTLPATVAKGMSRRETLKSIEYTIGLMTDAGCLLEDYKHVFKRRPYLVPGGSTPSAMIESTNGPLWTTRSLADVFPDAKIKFGRAVALQFCC